jgi:type VI secretion system secreted protein Hcp
MAETVHLFLKSNGSDVKGDSTQESLGRKDSIECVSYQQGVSNTTDDATKMATGRRQYTPITIRKRIDKASLLLIKALVNNEKIEGAFKFFRPSPTGDGTTEQFYTVTIKEGHVSAITQSSPNTLGAESANQPPYEEVAFVFKTINWTVAKGGVSHEDTWGKNA